MMMGVAQVMGMNETVRSFFSISLTCSWAKAFAVSSGNAERMMAVAALVPTSCKKCRRASSLPPKIARSTAVSTA
jgi:hypothetical protein